MIRALAGIAVATALLGGAAPVPVPGALPGLHYAYDDGYRGWPVAPVEEQHPIRGSLLDPRGTGYHVGIDISVRDDQPESGAPAGRSHRVYAVEGGTVSLPEDTARVGCVNREVEVGHFTYFHVDPAGVVADGAQVTPGQPIGWTCKNLWHVHLSEWQLVDGREVWVNPLHPGGKLEPFADSAAPVVRAIRFFTPAATVWPDVEGAVQAPPAGKQLPRGRLRGLVDVRALIADPQSFRGFLKGAFAFLYADHHPYRVRLEVTRSSDGKTVLARDVFRADAILAPAEGREAPDPQVPMGVHYAPDSSQNLGAKPCVDRQPTECRGRYWLRLFARPGGAYWNTSQARNGRYRLRVEAWDTAGNAGSATVEVTVAN